MTGFAFLMAMLAATPHGPIKHATDVRTPVDDDLTQKFVEALQKAVPTARHMRPEGGDDKDDLYLTVLFKVESDGKKFDYAVDLMQTVAYLPPNRLASLTGSCREKAIDACARKVIAEADKDVPR